MKEIHASGVMIVLGLLLYFTGAGMTNMVPTPGLALIVGGACWFGIGIGAAFQSITSDKQDTTRVIHHD